MEVKMLTIPVSPQFYALFRLKAAERNQTIAAFGRKVLEKAVEESSETTREKELVHG